jgi:hypothetical protein
MPQKRTKLSTVKGDNYELHFNDQDSESDALGPSICPEAIKKKYSRPEVPCWGCIHDFKRPTEVGADPAMDKLYEEFISNKDTMGLEAITEHLSKVHNNEFFIPSLQEGKPCLPWPAYAVMIHLLPASGHMFDEQIDIALTIRDYSVMTEELKRSLYRHTEHGPRVHEKTAKLYVAITNEKRKQWQLYHNHNR